MVRKRRPGNMGCFLMRFFVCLFVRGGLLRVCLFVSGGYVFRICLFVGCRGDVLVVGSQKCNIVGKIRSFEAVADTGNHVLDIFQGGKFIFQRTGAPSVARNIGDDELA